MAEGFHSWMWRGLSFIIPFLALVYSYYPVVIIQILPYNGLTSPNQLWFQIFQLYNAYYLYKLSLHPACVEWQVLWTAIIFLALFLGNTLTTSLVVHQKLREKFKEA
ncbi:TMEM120B [Cordylochernes scorpioides]|uniref:TMEM120B n=1 Tax=Cordylochernes scorpioides TaxID=51811 RepID=A0ABY6KT01_9ARAC|nr:TMEM120B [Cordylochernes scorpioides]